MQPATFLFFPPVHVVLQESFLLKPRSLPNLPQCKRAASISLPRPLRKHLISQGPYRPSGAITLSGWNQLLDMQSFLCALGEEIEDPEEESFLLFSQSIPSQNLGFVDSKATVLELTVNGRDLSIIQSPTILSSNRGGGTTGAVVWKITPLFASWITSSTNLLFKHSILGPNSAVLELGCGISGIIGLSLSPLLNSYTLTDQEYVFKLLNQNLDRNQQDISSTTRSRRGTPKSKRVIASITQNITKNIISRRLDWETDEVNPSLTGSRTKKSFDAVIACDCIYNDALIDPLVQTCIDVCKLRTLEDEEGRDCPTVCIVAQQLRSAEVFEVWLKAFYKAFRVWRVDGGEVIDELKSNSGFVIHVGILR